MINVTGLWRGEYTLGEGYNEALQGKTTQFAMELSWEENQVFNGTCLDFIPEVEKRQKATIAGYTKDQYIFFTKEYPVTHLIRSDGSRIEDSRKEKPLLYYDGYFDIETNSFKGQWALETVIEKEMRKRVVEKVVLKVVRGTWEMKRVK